MKDISAGLGDEPDQGVAHPLSENKGKIAEGVKIHGNGFIVSSEERARLVGTDPRYDAILQMYLSGEDVATHPRQEADRFVINFNDWDEATARNYPHLFAILAERVKPYRDGLTGQIHESRFWLFWDRREAFFKAMANAEHILVCSGVAKYVAVVFVSAGRVLSQKLKVFAYQDFGSFAVLQSEFHNSWVRRNSGTLGDTLSYSNSDAFLTFPFPLASSLKQLAATGSRCHALRASAMLSRQQGLTSFYNSLHDPDETSADISELREQHAQMDKEVAAAYGWEDLKLDHDFHQTKQGLRFTISGAARREVLARLLKLNHERYADEVARGLHEKGKRQGTTVPFIAASFSKMKRITIY